MTMSLIWLLLMMDMWTLGRSMKRSRVNSRSTHHTHRDPGDATEQHMNLIRTQLNTNMPSLLASFEQKGYAIVDNFLGLSACEEMRREAENYYCKDYYTISQSTRFDIDTNQIVTYNKHNVFSMQLDGGTKYEQGKRLHEYVVSMVKTIVPMLNSYFNDLSLNPYQAANKLAVCTGDGSYYDKHFDNMGNDDLRKITVIYYMNPKYKQQLGGCFRIYSIEGDEINTHDIEPIGDRLLVFRADSLVHSVLPSFATTSEEYRYALTIWLLTTNNANIIINTDEVTRHFGLSPDIIKKVNG